MGTIFIFNKLPWKPPIASKLLTPPVLELNLSYPDDEIKDMPGKQKAVFDTKFKALFDSKFNAMSQARMKQIQDAVKWTEEKIQGKNEKEMKETVETANKMLKQAFDVWQNEIATLCDQCVNTAYEESVKAMKMKLVKAKIKSVAKIILIAGLILTAAGLAIAASVVTGGALAPLILGALATGGAALWKAYKVYDSEWATSANKIKEIETDIASLKKAIEVYKKTEKTYAGKLDKVKAFKETIFAPVTDIDKHVGQLDKYIFDLQGSLKEQKEKLLALQKQAQDAKSGEVDAAVKTCIGNIDKATDQLKAINEAKASVVEIKSAYAAQKIPDYGKLNAVVARINSNSSTIQTIGSSISSCISSLKKIGVKF